MWQKRNEKPSKHMTKPAKVKLLKNPIKPVETTVISASSKLEGRIEVEGNLIIDGSVKGTISVVPWRLWKMVMLMRLLKPRQ